MEEYTSRAEQRQEKFFLLAEDHKYCCDEILYPSEARKLASQGFTVEKLDDFDLSRNLGIYHISWSKPYPEGVPHIVHSYIIGILKTCPENKISNTAQRLYVIAHKF